MRYLIAMIFAVAVALAITVFASPRIADLVVANVSFDSPDEVATLHVLVFMGVNLLALIGGWLIGWAVGGAVTRKETSA